MARTQKAQPRSSRPPIMTPEELPPVVPPRKHPLLLALAVVLFAAWIGFLIFLASRG
jgi:hypothetical protein